MSRRPVSAVALALAGALLAGCSAGGPDADGSGSPETEDDRPTLSAPELEGGTGADAAGGAPRFEGRRPMTLSAARRTAVDEPCTANQIERLCGSSAVFEVTPVGPPTRVVLTGASTRPERSGLTWLVRMRFAPDAAPLPLATARDDLVLEGADGTQVVVTPAAVVSGRVIELRGFPKRQAWSIVDQLAAEA